MLAFYIRCDEVSAPVSGCSVGNNEVSDEQPANIHTPEHGFTESRTSKVTQQLKNPGTHDKISVCSYNSNEFCLRHMRRGTWSTISTRCWKDRGGGRGFGYVNVKRKILSCSRTNVSSTSQFSSTSHAPPGQTMLSNWLRRKPPANQKTDGGNDVLGGKDNNFIGGDTTNLKHASNENEQTEGLTCD